MNKELLRERAVELESVARRYAALDPEAASLYDAMKPYLQQALDGTLSTPLEIGVLPRRNFFDEGSLRKYPEVEDACAKFSIEATGGETPALRLFRERMAANKSDA